MIRRRWLFSWFLLLPVALAAPTDGPETGESPVDGPKQQVERVMNAGLPFVERLLATRGEFAPFGAVMLHKGLIQNLHTDTGEGATTEQILNGLVTGLERGVLRGEYKALGVFTLVEMRRPDGESTQAVHVALEHLEGYCVDIFYPVVLRGDGLVLDEPIAGKRIGAFFKSCTGSSGS